MSIQRRAVVELGPNSGSLTDYSCDFSEFVIEDLRATVVKAPTPGSPNIEQRAGAASHQVRMSFLAAPQASSGLWYELYTAAKSPSGELFFQVRYDEAPVSASNPKRTGFIVVTNLLSGAAAYQARRQSVTVPARAVSDPLAA